MRSAVTSALKRVSVWAPLLWSLSCGGKLDTPSCREGGRDHSVGESWDCADGCNTCSCGENGMFSTLLACDVAVSPGDSSDAGSTSAETSEPITDTNDETDVSPDDTDVSPDDTDVSPDDTDVSPHDTDVSPEDAGVSAHTCLPHVTSVEAPLVDEIAEPLHATWVWTESGLVGLRSRATGSGLELWHVDKEGASNSAGYIWFDYQFALDSVATVGNAIAISQLGFDENGRSTCQLAIASVEPFAGMLGLVRVSDAPNAGTILNESKTCTVVALDDGFVVVWGQATSDTSDEQTLFAQRVDPQGRYIGERWTIAVGDKGVVPQSVESNGERVLIALYPFSDEQQFYALTSDGAEPVSVDQTLIDAGGVEALVAVGQNFMAFTRGDAYLMRPQGEVVSAGLSVSATSVGALGENIVAVAREEFLPVRTWDPKLEHSSEPTTLSADRLSSFAEVVTSPTRDQVAVFFAEDGKARVAFIECGTEATPDPVTSCVIQDPLLPLDTGCADAVCHTVVRLDSINLAVRGWAVVGDESQAVDLEGVAEIAGPVFQEFNEYGSDFEVSGPHAGVYYALQQPLDFGGFVMVGARSGKVITAGGIVYDGTGNYWLPETWQDPGEVMCGSQSVSASETAVIDQDCDDEGDTPLPTAQDALDLVLSTNLAAYVADHGEFSAYSTLYTRTVGACSRAAAEFIVVLTQD